MPKPYALPAVCLYAALLSPALAGGAGPAPAAPLEVWAGTYTCAQGVTGARLSISGWTGDTFRLMGEMYPVSSNAGVPKGRAELWGTLEGDLNSGNIHLTGWRWLLRPQGYDLAKLSAKYELGGDYRHIKLNFEKNAFGCTGAEFNRVK